MASRPCIWLTRPRADSEAFAAMLAAHGIASIIAPVMHIVPAEISENNIGEKPAAILLTSRHAVHALKTLPDDWRTLPVYSVGNATADAARDAGFKNLITGDGDVLSLLPRIAQDIKINQHLLYLAGAETRADIPTLLGAQGILVNHVTTYHAVAEAELSPELIDALNTNSITAAVFFSARSATIAGDLLEQHNLAERMGDITACCLSLNVAAATAVLGCAHMHTCHIPTAEAMCDLIVSLTPQTMV